MSAVTILLVLMIAVAAVLGVVAYAVITMSGMEFDDVVDATGSLVKQVPNQSARIVGQFIDRGP